MSTVEKYHVWIGDNKMSVNIKEANLEAITYSIAFMEKDENCDEVLLKKLKEERRKLLKDLNVINWKIWYNHQKNKKYDQPILQFPTTRE